MFDEQIFHAVYTKIGQLTLRKYRNPSSRLVRDTVLDGLIANCFHPLMARCWERLLMVEMNLAEAEGLLQGKTNRDRFDYFTTEILKDENFRFLLTKYPGVWKRWSHQTRLLLKNIHTFLHRIDEDLLTAAQSLNDDHDIAEVIEVCMLGDPHRGMQQTARIRYINEHDIVRTIYYKPRHLGIDQAFAKFIAWWNAQSDVTHIVPRVLPKEGYGWTQHIDHASCASVDEVRQYYKRYGSLVAIAHILGATDLHKENIVAAGSFPVIVDSETLFSCTFERSPNLARDGHLYSSLLLPTQRMRGTIEISPLTARSGGAAIEILINTQLRESDARMQVRKLTTKPCNCEVLLGKTPIADCLAYAADIIDGMRTTYDLITHERKAVFRQLSNAMWNKPVRIVYRSTPDYMTVLHNSWHPDALIDDSWRRDLLKLSDPLTDPDFAEDELRQLQDGDVPYFEMKFDNTSIIGHNGRQILVPVQRSPSQKLHAQLSRLSPSFIKQAVDDLNYALAAYKLREGREPEPSENNYRHLSDLTHQDWLCQMARLVMNQVLAQVVTINGNHYWRTISGAGVSETQAGLTNHYLYDGVAGIALAFHVTGRQLQERRYLNFARRLAKQLANEIDANPVAELGALTGTAGSLWVVSVITGKAFELQPLIRRTLSKLCLRLLSQKWERYGELDYISGASGTIEMLLRLHKHYIDFPIAYEIRKLAALLFDYVVRLATVLRKDDTLLGFAHGTAGVSAVLAQFMRQFSVQDDAARSVIRSNVARETELRRDTGWPRLDTDYTIATSWCHGTVGFGFSRLYLDGCIDPSILRDDMQIIRSRLAEAKLSSGLCHGLMADYCLAKALDGDGNPILELVRQAIEKRGFITDYGLSDFELVGAMTGITGLFTGPAILTGQLEL